MANGKYRCEVANNRTEHFPVTAKSIDHITGCPIVVRPTLEVHHDPQTGKPLRNVVIHSGSTPCVGVSSRNTSGLRSQSSPAARVTAAWLAERRTFIEAGLRDLVLLVGCSRVGLVDQADQTDQTHQTFVGLIGWFGLVDQTIKLTKQTKLTKPWLFW